MRLLSLGDRAGPRSCEATPSRGPDSLHRIPAFDPARHAPALGLAATAAEHTLCAQPFAGADAPAHRTRSAHSPDEPAAGVAASYLILSETAGPAGRGHGGGGAAPVARRGSAGEGAGRQGSGGAGIARSPSGLQPGETCPVSTEGGTRRVQLVREGGGGGERLPADGASDFRDAAAGSESARLARLGAAVTEVPPCSAAAEGGETRGAGARSPPAGGKRSQNRSKSFKIV